jgi:hypothetical protein
MNYESEIMNYGKNLKLFFLATVLLFTGAACVSKSGPGVNLSPTAKTDTERAVAEAKKVFAEQKAGGVDMSSGPCLSNEIILGWVADVVHNPRQAVDNLPANQCSAYREGKARHFVELDTEGNLIRTN